MSRLLPNATADVRGSRAKPIPSRDSKFFSTCSLRRHDRCALPRCQYQFRRALAVTSKLDTMVAWRIRHVAGRQDVRRFIPARLLLFGVIGALGLLVHMTVLAVALYGGLAFTPSQAIAVLTSMTSNFTLNNLITYRDRRLRGWGWVRGLVSFISSALSERLPMLASPPSPMPKSRYRGWRV